MKQRIYLDTSVFSALHDSRAPDRQGQTLLFWARLGEFEASTSEASRGEAEGTPDRIRRERLLESISAVSVFPVTPEMRNLARRYIAEGIFSTTQETDAIHVAAAVLTRHDILLSWNFKHLVNRRRRAAINALNLALGIPSVDIIPPPEL